MQYQICGKLLSTVGNSAQVHLIQVVAKIVSFPITRINPKKDLDAFNSKTLPIWGLHGVVETLLVNFPAIGPANSP